MPAPASVCLTGVDLRRPDSTPIFEALTLTFGPGCTGIVGGNGAGKTTLLRLIAGEVAPAAGRLRVNGRVGLMRQAPVLAPGARLVDLFAPGPAAPVAAALSRCGLDLAPETPLAALSGGQRSRARLAAAIVGAPEVLLLDEPTNDLDAEGRRAVARLIGDWRGVVLVASHDRALLAQMAAILALTPTGAVYHPGPYDSFLARAEAARGAAQHDLAEAAKSADRAARSARRAT